MDLYVEKQCVDQMRGGDLSRFLMLLDANFEELYKYVFRRVTGRHEAEEIVRLSFLDALNQARNVPTDSGYLIWLFSLAKPRVWEEIGRASFPEKQGLMSIGDVVTPADGDLVSKAEKMMGKLSLEEREILRLKFFEQVADGDVMTILGIEEGAIGPKIYRVLKRAHFLLFGESDERQGVYFGELSGFLVRVRALEKIETPEAFRLSLRADIASRIDRREFTVKAEEIEVEEQKGPEDLPFVHKEVEHVGSNDPAKIFVEAVREMREEEEREFERKEAIFDFLDRWKNVLVGFPIAIFLGIVIVFMVDVFGFGALKRGYSTECSIEVGFEGEFSDGEIRSVNDGISDRICGHFEVSELIITRGDDGRVDVGVKVPDWSLDYKFVKKVRDWRIKEYARTADSNEKSGKV